MHIHIGHQDYDWALGSLLDEDPGSILGALHVCCTCKTPLTKCGNLAESRGPRHTLDGVSGSSRLKEHAEASFVNAAGRLWQRAAREVVTLVESIGLAKWLAHLCHVIPHGHFQAVDAWQPLHCVHHIDLTTLKQSN